VTCSFCGAERAAVRHLVEAPATRICDGCIARAADATDTDEGVTCTFCRTALASFIAGDGAICPECVRLCEDILREASPGGLPAARVIKR
jgi:ATP-dependent protease Clp ATPase subunit